MTDENSLVDRIVDGLRREVEQLVRSTNAAADSLDETEQKAVPLHAQWHEQTVLVARSVSRAGRGLLVRGG